MTARWSAAGGQQTRARRARIIAGTTTSTDHCGDARKRNRIKPSVLAAVELGGPYHAGHLKRQRRPRRRPPRQAAPLSVRPTRAHVPPGERARACALARTRADGPVFGRRFRDRFARVVTRSLAWSASLVRELDRTKSLAFYYLCGLGSFMPGRLVPESIRKQRNVNENLHTTSIETDW